MHNERERDREKDGKREREREPEEAAADARAKDNTKRTLLARFTMIGRRRKIDRGRASSLELFLSPLFLPPGGIRLLSEKEGSRRFF